MATLVVMGMEFAKKGDLQQAANSFQEYLQMQPDDYKIHATLGTVFTEMGQAERAIEQYTQALKLNSEYEPVLENLKALRSKNNPPQPAN